MKNKDKNSAARQQNDISQHLFRRWEEDPIQFSFNNAPEYNFYDPGTRLNYIYTYEQPIEQNIYDGTYQPIDQPFYQSQLLPEHQEKHGTNPWKDSLSKDSLWEDLKMSAKYHISQAADFLNINLDKKEENNKTFNAHLQNNMIYNCPMQTIIYTNYSDYGQELDQPKTQTAQVNQTFYSQPQTNVYTYKLTFNPNPDQQQILYIPQNAQIDPRAMQQNFMEQEGKRSFFGRSKSMTQNKKPQL